MNHNYARDKLQLLLRDLDYYNDGEFQRQMMRIVSGATGVNLEKRIAELENLVAELATEGVYLVDRYNVTVQDPCQFVDAETFFNAMQAIKPELEQTK